MRVWHIPIPLMPLTAVTKVVFAILRLIYHGSVKINWCVYMTGVRPSKKRFNYKVKQPLSLSQFKHLVEYHEDNRPCTLESLAVWLLNKTDVRIVTDGCFYEGQTSKKPNISEITGQS